MIIISSVVITIIVTVTLIFVPTLLWSQDDPTYWLPVGIGEQSAATVPGAVQQQAHPPKLRTLKAKA